MMVGRTYLVWVTVGAALLLACGAALVMSIRPAEASFPGKNGLLVFSAPDADGGHEIFTSKLDGSSLKQRTNAEGFSAEPKWSPDGTKIAFTSNRDGNNEIYVKDLTTGKTLQLTDTVQPPGTRALSIDSPVWSPNGAKIAYNRFISYDDLEGTWCRDVFVMNADGSNAKDLRGGCGFEYVEAWSPDGTKIAITSAFSEYPHPRDIWVIKPDGSEARNLTNTPWQFDEREVDWKPNGRKITYTREPDESLDFQNRDVWKMNPDGSDKDRLTFSVPDEHVPLWSPDGRKIIYTSSEGVMMMNVDGTNKTNVPGLASTVDADWQPIPTP
jgi:Tol biopolymer transport system component